MKAESVLTSLSRRGRTEGRVRSYFVVAAGGGLKAESVLSSLSRRGGLKAESVLLRCRGINLNDMGGRCSEQEECSIEVADEAPNEAADEAPYGVADVAPNEAADEAPNEAADNASYNGADEVPNEAADEALNEAAETLCKCCPTPVWAARKWGCVCGGLAAQ